MSYQYNRKFGEQVTRDNLRIHLSQRVVSLGMIWKY